MGKKKKATASNPARGFATTSLPSKTKPTTPPPPEPDPLVPCTTQPEQTPTWQPPTEAELAEFELLEIVTNHIPKVRRETQRIMNKAETEKRTLRITCYPLRLDRVLGVAHLPSTVTGAGSNDKESLGEKILRLAREEYLQQLARTTRRGDGTSKEDKCLLVTGWTLHKVLTGLGFPRRRVEEGVKAILSREGAERKDVEALLEEVLEWVAMFCETEEMPRFLDTSVAIATLNGAKKGSELQNFVPSITRTDAAIRIKGLPSTPASCTGASTPVPTIADTRHLSKTPSSIGAPSAEASLRYDTLVNEISNLNLESKDISGQGSNPAFSDIDDKSEEDSEDFDFETELTPENLIPTYLSLQTRLYNIHPNCASTIVGGKKVKGGGRKPTKAAPQAPPKSLSDKQKSTVKRLQQNLSELERDLLFDSYVADIAWRDTRAKLDEESWSKKQAKEKQPKAPLSTGVRSESGTAEAPEEDMSLLGSLFEGPPTEEPSASGESVSIRDFEESSSKATNTFGSKVGKGKAGVGAAAMRKLVQEICKSRDVNSKVRFDVVSGTSISSRSRLTITWSSPADITPPPEGMDDPDVLVQLPEDNKTIFEMKKLAAATSDQADGFIVTFALFTLFARKEEKLYLRLPTVWRNIWVELVEEEKNRSEREEMKLLEVLKELLRPEFKADKEPIESMSKVTPKTTRGDTPGEDPSTKRKPKASYEKYLESEDIKEAWQRRRSLLAFQQMEAHRQSLPMWSFREEVIRAVEGNSVVVLSGETGCGKSTQLPTFLLEHEMMTGRPCKIYCTQPRRISALSLARRVSEEMGEGKGKVGGLVGYAIRLENMVSDATRLVYATTGIVMRMLERNPELDGVTHLILDEVHERSIESDFLLVVLKRLLAKRKDLKVVLMSATVDAERFSDYLGGAPVLKVPGRTFPVQEFYLEDAIETTNFKAEDDLRGPRTRKGDYDDNDADLDMDSGSGNFIGGSNLQSYKSETRATLNKLDHYRIPYELIVKLLETISTSPQYVDYSKAILIFLPGLGEIRRLNDMILGHPMFGPHRTGGWLVYPLHSTIASEEQEQAFLVPPPGVRKIVLATNIAETGITIPDVTAVIDTGKHKEMRFDEKRQLSRLVETFISRANAKQRRGRAGRVQPGICWHLFTKVRHDALMSDQQTPEIMRLSLQDLVLRVKICALGNIEEVLTSALDSPTPKNIRRAIDSLVDVKALTSEEELTPLGRQLAKLPLDVYLGKLTLLGSIFSSLDAVLTIAAMLSSKSPFMTPIGSTFEAERARASFARGDSDLLTGYNAYCSWRRVCLNRGGALSEADFCRKNYISSRTMNGIEDLKLQLTAAVVEAGFLRLAPQERSALNRARFATFRRSQFFTLPASTSINSNNDTLVNSIVAAAFYPKLLVREGKGWKNIGASVKVVKIHQHSVNRHNDKNEWLSYYGIMQGGRGSHDAHETGRVEEVAIAVLCGDAEFKMYPGITAIDGNRIRFSFSDWRGMVAIKTLRLRIRELVNRSYRNPEKGLTEGHKMWLGIWEEVMKVVGERA